MQPILSLAKPPSFWELDSQGKPKKMDAVVHALNFFEHHKNWIVEHPGKSREYFTLLSDTHFNLSELSETAWKTYARLLQNFSARFPMKNFPSQVRKSLLNAGLKWKLGELLWPFLFNAPQQLEGIPNQLQQLIKDIKSSSALLSDKKPGCIYYHTYPENFSIVTAMDQWIPVTLIVDFSIDKEAFTHILNSCPLIERLFVIDYPYELDSSILNILKQMPNLKEFEIVNKEFTSPQELDRYITQTAPISIPSLTLNSDDFTDEWLSEFSKKIPNLQSLKINSNGITSIPFKQLLILDCIDCSQLKELVLPHAQEIYCSNCPELSILTAPVANNVECIQCASLTELSLPCADSGKIKDCRSLKTAEVRAETYFKFSSCLELERVITPNETKIERSQCPKLGANYPTYYGMHLG